MSAPSVRTGAELIAALPARAIAALLGDLVAASRRDAAGEQPVWVTLKLRSGAEVHGRVLDRAVAGTGAVVLVHSPGADPRRQDGDAVYVDEASIEALIVHDAPQVANLLSSGHLAPAPRADQPPPPSRLEIRRRAAEREPHLAGVLGHPVVIEVAWDGVREGEPMRALDRLLAELVTALEWIATEGGGRGALGGIHRLMVKESPDFGVWRSGDGLVVEMRLSVGLPAVPSTSELRAAIERVL